MSKTDSFSNDYYELQKDTKFGLQHVMLKSSGVQEIARQYQEKYPNIGGNIIVEEYSNVQSKSKAEFFQKLNEHIAILPNDAVQGIIFNSISLDGSFVHATPYIIAKSADQVVIVNFESRFLLDKTKYIVKKVENYENFQKDLTSCGIFAVNTLKNCLINQDFIAAVKQVDQKASEDLETITIPHPKQVIGQGKNFVDLLSTEKKQKYVHAMPDLSSDGSDKLANFKAFYKGHCYARKLNSSHLDLLDEKTRNLVLAIDLKRQEIKDEKSELDFKGEINFDDDEVDLPDNSATPRKTLDGQKLSENLKHNSIPQPTTY